MAAEVKFWAKLGGAVPAGTVVRQRKWTIRASVAAGANLVRNSPLNIVVRYLNLVESETIPHSQ